MMGIQENGNGSNTKKYRRMYADENGDMDILDFSQQNGNDTTRKYVMACAVFASLNSVLLGYDIGVMSGAILFIQEDLKISDVQVEVLVGILSIISLLGSLAAGKTSDAIGRKWTMGFAAVIFQTGACIMALASSFRILMIGRLLAGIGIGFAVMIAPVYIAEIAPATARGSLTSFPEIFINFGILLGYVSNYAFSGLPAHINWRIMLGVGVVPSIFIGCALFVIPESPRWLVMKNRIDEARHVLLMTIEHPSEVEEKLAEIQVAAGNSNGEKYVEKAFWREILNPSPGIWRMLIAGCGIQCFQQITGIDTMVYYSPTIFKDAGITDETHLLAATVGIGFTKTIFILIAIFLIDRAGRKPLLYVSTIGMTVCLFTLGITLYVMGNDKSSIGIILAIICVCGNVAFFSIGIGPICWVLSSEVFPLKLRAQASALASIGSRVSSGVIAMSFLSVSHAITVGGTFLVFSAISALSVAFVYKCVPETKGKTLEEIEAIFHRTVIGQGGEVQLEDVKHLMQEQSDE